jgi:hypothetical protein
MTILLQPRFRISPRSAQFYPQNEIVISRPEESGACGPSKAMKNASVRHPLSMEPIPSPCHPERLSELSSDRQSSPSRVKLELLHLSSPWTGAPCLHRRSRGTTWVEQDGAAPLPLFSFACSEAKETKSSLARRAERCAADLSRLPRLAVGRAVEGSAVLRTFRGNVL